MLLDNLRGGRLAEKEAGLPKAGAFRAAAAGDLNGGRAARPRLDSGEAATFVALNRGDGTFLPATARLGPAAAPLLFDFDNDGFLDLFVPAVRRASTLWRGDGAGELRAGGSGRASRPRSRPTRSTSTATATSTSSSSRRTGGAGSVENRGGNANGWIDVALEGLPTGSAKVNRFGYGSEVEAKAQDLYVYRVASRP